MRMLSPVSTEFAWPRRVLSPSGMTDVFEDFDRVVDAWFAPVTATKNGFQPSCDVRETKDHYLVSFDIPGMKKEDIKIELKDNNLVISGERHREVKEQDEESIIRRERMYGKFERTFTLPSTVAADKIEAHFENGVLNIALPKAEIAKARTIQIQTGEGGLLGKLF